MRWAIAALALAGAASVRAKAPALVLTPEQMVEFRLAGDTFLAQRAPVAWILTSDQLTTVKHSEGMVGQSDVPSQANLAKPHQVTMSINSGLRASFATVAQGRETVLLLENKTERALRYRAAITGPDGRTQATDVCVVPPHQAVTEHWPYVISRIVLSQVEALTWREGDTPTCG